MAKELTPIALLVDDSCPFVHVYLFHHRDARNKQPLTGDGRPLLDFVPNSFLNEFCDVCDRWNIAGKFSIVPMPAGLGNVADGIKGFSLNETKAWLETAKRRLGQRFDFTPEGITHGQALDLSSGEMLSMNESDWSQKQTRETLTPYLICELELLKAAGIDANGFTSPWVFGIESEPEYIISMVSAQRKVYGRDTSWYFLHMIFDQPSLRPWVAYQDNRGRLVSIPSTVPDIWWETIDNAKADPHDIALCLYKQCQNIAKAKGFAVALTHWQSLFSNGLALGLKALDDFGGLIAEDQRFEWRRCSELAEIAQ